MRPPNRVRANIQPAAATNAGGASSNGNSACGERASQSSPASDRSEEHTSELQSLMRISYAVFCLKKKKQKKNKPEDHIIPQQKLRLPKLCQPRRRNTIHD